jgi:hypothetical protein
MAETGRAFQFKHSRSYHAVDPNDSQKYKDVMRKPKAVGGLVRAAKKLQRMQDRAERKRKGRGMSPSKSRPKAGPGGMSPDTRSRPKRPKPSPRKPRPKTYPPKRIMTPLAKGGRSFPDLSGDGKVTRKDILMGRGVIKK